MFNMFGPKMGTWIVTSEEDPRWNKAGTVCGFVLSSGSEEMRIWTKKCVELYGDPPSDIMISFYNDTYEKLRKIYE